MKRLPSIFISCIRFPRTPWKWISVLFVILMFGFGTNLLYEKLTRLPPLEAVEQGLGKTLTAQSFRYAAVAKRTLDRKESVISDLTGEKNLKGVHIKGTIPLIKADVEVYQYPDAMYRRDSLTQGWVTVPSTGRANMEQLIAEINPLSAFNFNENIEAKYAGQAKIDGDTCRVYEVMARGQNKYLELYWQDFNYLLWLDKKEGFIRKAEITAEHRDNSQHILKLSVTLWDFNESFEITPPPI